MSLVGRGTNQGPSNAVIPIQTRAFRAQEFPALPRYIAKTLACAGTLAPTVNVLRGEKRGHPSQIPEPRFSRRNKREENGWMEEGVVDDLLGHRRHHQYMSASLALPPPLPSELPAGGTLRSRQGFPWVQKHSRHIAGVEEREDPLGPGRHVTLLRPARLEFRDILLDSIPHPQVLLFLDACREKRIMPVGDGPYMDRLGPKTGRQAITKERKMLPITERVDRF